MKTFLALSVLLFSLFILSCSETPTKSEPESVDEISGYYFIHGTKIEYEFYFPWSDDNIESADTLEIAFTVLIRKMQEKKDTVQFVGLEKAFTYITECNTQLHCAYSKISGSELEFDVSIPSGRYYGSGTLADGKLTLDTKFRYRGNGTDYQLEGNVIE